jgi:hypothetical protein
MAVAELSDPGVNPQQSSLPLPAGTASSPEAASSAPAAQPSVDSSVTAVPRAYPAPAEMPTQQGAKGLQFDFNDGCRVVLPETENPWRVRLSDLDTGNIAARSDHRHAAWAGESFFTNDSPLKDGLQSS